MAFRDLSRKKLFIKYFALIIGVFFLTGLTPLWAQTAGYFMELRFVQRFAWTGDEYAMHYEVIVEREEEGQYRRFFQEFTRETFIRVSLLPGNYRFQVIPYDYLEQPIQVYEWIYFEVLRGDSKLATGKHEIIVISPFDERNQAEIILVVPEESVTGFKNQFDIYVGAAWVPKLLIHGENQFFGGENSSLYSAALRIGVVSAGQNFINPGMELVTSWRAYDSMHGNKLLHSFAFDFNLLAQLRFPNDKTSLNFRWGAGVSMLPDIDPVSSTGQYSLHANAGVSFLYVAQNNLYFEIGIDYSQLFTRDYFGFLRPWIGLGYRF
ncbi:MAG: hypothetical protein FWD87_09855 [Spirochaetaceae bacterium]|nr:hypothetical protein [Spirochaetaceae bacterium]